jgi:hypothetical protein
MNLMFAYMISALYYISFHMIIQYSVELRRFLVENLSKNTTTQSIKFNVFGLKRF